MKAQHLCTQASALLTAIALALPEALADGGSVQGLAAAGSVVARISR